MLWTSIFELNAHLESVRKNHQIACTSGGCDILHAGHLNYFLGAARFGYQVVILNSDQFLQRKKGYWVVPWLERARLIQAIPGVQEVVWWDDGTQTVVGALHGLRPDFFCKGGDRQPENMSPEEVEACAELGIQIEYGVGGFSKDTGSSPLIQSLFERLGVGYLLNAVKSQMEKKGAGQKEGWVSGAGGQKEDLAVGREGLSRSGGGGSSSLD